MTIKPEDGSFCVYGAAPFENVNTFGETVEEAREMAIDALTGVIASMLEHNLPVPRPPLEVAAGTELFQPEAAVALAVLIRWAREEAGLTQGQAAERLGIKQQSYQRLEKPDANPSIKTVTKALKAMGRELQLSI